MRIHLVRHGEVENPDHVVYADLPGFVLSRRGRQQARAAGRYLADAPLLRIVTSPLERARETSELVADATGAAISVDDRLVEWGLSSHWAGVAWESLSDVFPGELEAYLSKPYDLPFSPESLSNVAERVAECVADWAQRDTGEIAFVSHEDPLHGGRLKLTGESPAEYHRDKPTHCSVTTLDGELGEWSVVGYWAPPQ